MQGNVCLSEMFSLKRLVKALACALLVVAGHADAAAPRAQDDKTAEAVFGDQISGPVIQSKCVNCHVAGGVSGHTRLVFVRASDATDHAALNLQALEDFLDAVEGGGNYVLNKIQGVAHGGGVQVPLGSGHFASMERLLGLLGEAVARVRLTPQTLFDTVVLASDRKTLRRAALIFAGRIPTDEEYAAIEDGDESGLRATIRSLMDGPEFHAFLLRGSNDRLLTDREDGELLSPVVGHLVGYTNESYRRATAVGSRNSPAYWSWQEKVQYGARRAPLELIAHVVENDLPYTEILTADYIMANPMTAAAYGDSTRFDDPEDVHEFRPSRIVDYYRMGEGYESEYDPFSMAVRVLEPGPLHTNYPHAGILNTMAFLKRYPSTATNRNRARSRWTYYHFLGLDIEKSASRTTDPVALADTNNPTMFNPACTVCHSVLDPVAGAFQNYGDEGWYRDKWGGEDSLDDLYKEGKVAAMAVQAESREDRETLVWPLTLAAGTETLRVMYTNDFYDESTGDDGYVWLDRLRVVDADGVVVASQEFEDLEIPLPPWEGTCGEAAYNHATERRDHVHLWNGGRHCAFFIDIEVPADGAYSVEVVAWSIGYHGQYGNDGFARLSVTTNAYQAGDTWFRDMRDPGFNGALTPSADNSVQWLARQIVADPRFAEATVKFWWPALMGREAARPPEDQGDADFEGQLLAATAQGAEVARLAQGFRVGFQGGLAYNLKDLLVEMVLSTWFRADAVTDADAVRHVALRGAGAKRLLTPEELASKTAAITGVQWGRYTPMHLAQSRFPSALTDEYRLLYGGIDSDGVTQRSRDSTSVMAGVARRHAVEVSCLAVMREFYLVSEAERLFAGIDLSEQGADAIKDKLVELHDTLLGVQVTRDSADVEAAYRLFVQVMENARASGHDWFQWWDCPFSDQSFLEGILDGVVVLAESGSWYEFDWERVDAFMKDLDFSDPHATGRAWKAVLTYLLMDPRYLYLH